MKRYVECAGIARPNQENKSFLGNDIKVNSQGQCARTKSTETGLLPVYITRKIKVYNTNLDISFSKK